MADHNQTSDDAFKAPEPAELSRMLPSFKVTQLLASGASSAVYVARQKSLDRNVAIKVMPGREGPARSRFEKEARAMAKLRHPNLIGVHDFGEADGFLYLVMDFVDGKSLRRSTRGEAIDQKTALKLILSICEGLAHAHKAGIIHQAIKPDNILIGSNLEPRVGDFGLPHHGEGGAASAARLDHIALQYAAPEVANKRARADRRSDVYSLGVLLHELLTGELPDGSFTPPLRSREQRLDPRFEKILQRAMHPSPGKRFSDARALQEDLKPLLKNLGQGNLMTRDSEVTESGESLAEAKESQHRAVQQSETLAAMAATESRRYDRLITVKILVIAVLVIALLSVWSAYNRRKDESSRKAKIAERQKNAMSSGEKENPWANLQRDPIRETKEAPRPQQAREWTLFDLKEQLLRGDRDRFPEGAWDLADRKVYFVRSAMSWSAASRFAESHGAHLATLRSDEERLALLAKLPKGKITWLGGGMTGSKSWGWVDGTSSPLSTPSEATGQYLSMSESGTVRASPGRTKYPFFLQWHLDGKNPGSLEAQLQRFNLSIDQRIPEFPPGTVTNGDRHYLVLERVLGWEKARIFAEEANGHLAVIGNQEEQDYLERVIATCLPEKSAAWLGGSYSRGAWRWVTNEAWSFTSWLATEQDFDPESTALCFTSGEPSGWANRDPESELAALIIEWSRDQFSEQSAATGDMRSWTTLRNQCSVKLTTIREKFLQLLKANGASMSTALDEWHTGLSLQNRGRYTLSFQQAKGRIAKDGRINEEGRLPALPAEIASVCNACLREQGSLDQEYADVMESTRKTYIQQLGMRLSEARERRQFSEVSAIEAELESVMTVQTFVSHFNVSGDD